MTRRATRFVRKRCIIGAENMRDDSVLSRTALTSREHPGLRICSLRRGEEEWLQFSDPGRQILKTPITVSPQGQGFAYSP